MGIYVGNGTARAVNNVLIGNGIARAVQAGFVGVKNVARAFFSGKSAKYTGTIEQAEVEIDGVPHEIYRLITSGTLKLNKDARVWLCGGGGDGAIGYYFDRDNNYNYSDKAGGGGGGGYCTESKISKGTYVVEIGSNCAQSKIGSITALPGDSAVQGKAPYGSLSRGAAGGSGGGTGAESSRGSGYGGNGGSDGSDGIYVGDDTVKTSQGKGSGKTTIPFSIEQIDNFNYHSKHCAGGGGGCTSTAYSGAQGGEFGGGNGGMSRRQASSASYYGGGGGGNVAGSSADPKSGYQGVAYILVPK